MKRVVILALLLAIVTVAGGCPPGESPADVARDFLWAGNEGDYARAKGYLIPETRMVFEMDPMIRFDNAMDAVTRGGTITRIEVVEAVVHADVSATVMVTLHYADGRQQSDVLSLVKQDGKWRIAKSSLLIKGAWLP
ncbi:MAG: Lipoprotein LpqB [Chloroflexi bacterium]|nr:Lipoprotein LpqB [Chloroflexota bacterium]